MGAKQSMFLVEMYGGDYEEYWHQLMFVTKSETYANKWVEKANRVMGAYLEYLRTKMQDISLKSAGGEDINDSEMLWFDKWLNNSDWNGYRVRDVEVR